MSKVDHADDAVNHRVADGDQGVGTPDRQPIDELLGKIEEILHCIGTPKARSPRYHTTGAGCSNRGRGRFSRRLEKHLLPDPGEKVFSALPFFNDLA